MEPPPLESDQREQRYIDSLLRSAPVQTPLRVPPGDDAAVLSDGTAITADALVEGVHFDDRLAPGDVGWKAVAVSASDLGAMGACPAWMVLCLSVPSHTPVSWVEAFAVGLGEAAKAFSVSLIGGDTTGSPGPKVVSITMGGPCAADPIRRDSASPGDLLWVTGRLGLAGAGWMLADPPAAALAALRRPTPPVALALALSRAGLPTAMMDLSDGLAADLPRLCRASGCGADVDADALPVPDALRGHPDSLKLMTGGGEDYELLFASKPGDRQAISALAESRGIEVAVIGCLTEGSALRMSGSSWPSPAFQHFGGGR